MKSCWDILGIEPTNQVFLVKKAYANQVKLFKQLEIEGQLPDGAYSVLEKAEREAIAIIEQATSRTTTQMFSSYNREELSNNLKESQQQPTISEKDFPKTSRINNKETKDLRHKTDFYYGGGTFEEEVPPKTKVSKKANTSKHEKRRPSMPVILLGIFVIIPAVIGGLLLVSVMSGYQPEIIDVVEGNIPPIDEGTYFDDYDDYNDYEDLYFEDVLTKENFLDTLERDEIILETMTSQITHGLLTDSSISVYQEARDGFYQTKVAPGSEEKIRGYAKELFASGKYAGKAKELLQTNKLKFRGYSLEEQDYLVMSKEDVPLAVFLLNENGRVTDIYGEYWHDDKAVFQKYIDNRDNSVDVSMKKVLDILTADEFEERRRRYLVYNSYFDSTMAASVYGMLVYIEPSYFLESDIYYRETVKDFADVGLLNDGPIQIDWLFKEGLLAGVSFHYTEKEIYLEDYLPDAEFWGEVLNLVGPTKWY